MKKSHRKDVIIARIIFALLVLAVVLLIIFGVKAAIKYMGSRSDKKPVNTQEMETETQTEEETYPTVDPAAQWLIDDTETQETETEVAESAYHTLRADYGVNLREKPTTDSNVLAKVTVGETVLLLEESEDGWGKVQYKDKTGYMKLEYLTDQGVVEEE